MWEITKLGTESGVKNIVTQIRSNIKKQKFKSPNELIMVDSFYGSN